jgi:5-methylcytosine-specific restriction endonuclease McrA
MKLGCFYCGQLALTLDRLDSYKEHAVDNCVGCCRECNQAKGAVDPKTFVLQAVYRRTFVYYEDKDIWHVQTKKPQHSSYKFHANNQGRSFELTPEQFEYLVKCPCHYCKRIPEKYFGIDKLFPDDGYIARNVVTACASCNWAKWNSSEEEFTLREIKITQRYLDGIFDYLPKIPKNISYYKK